MPTGGPPTPRRSPLLKFGPSAAAAVAGKSAKFAPSRFQGGEALIRANAPQDNIDMLIDNIAGKTGVDAAKVHQVVSMSFQSTARFVLETASQLALQDALKRLDVQGAAKIVPAV